MLDLRRLRLLRELHERGTIAAVADALQFTPSAVSQQLAMLERETGVRLLERAGRGVRLTDPALVLVGHAHALLDEAARAEAGLAAAVGTVTGRGRIACFQSAAMRIAVPAMARLAVDAPDLRCELVGGEPEEALPALALGDVDLVIGDEWQHVPWRMPPGLDRHELLLDPVVLALPAGHAAAGGPGHAVALAELATAAWISGPVSLGWDEITERLCRERGRFTPQVRHRMNDAVVAAELVAAGLGVALLPELALPDDDPRLAIRQVARERPTRVISAVTRAGDAERPSTQALLAAVRRVAEARRPRARG
ncbi:LysR family transcriptional regulator [Baekduia soli]|uniref:LysR family transcriptional regulator n=1 Tax=Baekduia soli TaxID=496014 RepID=A0A5B8U3B8_9ACTN|nr:LysR family transcriptional regulator [Baekduia soli]QEC47544.1 LysR family transcriptional regulator [Baekduia soli]